MTPSPTPPTLMRRIALAFGAFFGILADAALAARFETVRDAADTAPVPAPAPAPVAAPAPVVALKTAPAESALQLLGLFQRDARLIDFVQESLAGYDDAQIGAAARLV